jgi:hypothetical protein
MSGIEDFSSWLVEQLNMILRPLKKNLEDVQSFSKLLTEHGWEIPSNVQEIQSLFPLNEFNNLENVFEQLFETDTENVAEVYSQAYSNLKNIIIKVRKLSDDRPMLNGIFPFDVNEFWSEFPEEIVDDLVIRYLESYHSSVFGLILFLGLIEENVRVMNGIPGRINYTKRVIHWHLLKDLINPLQLIRREYGWGSDQFQFEIFLNRLNYVLNSFGVKAYLSYPPNQLINQYYDPDNPSLPDVQELRIPLLGGTDDQEDPFDFELLLSLIPITPKNERVARPNGFAVGPSIIGSFQSEEELSPDDELFPLAVKLKGGFELDQGIRLEVRPQQVDIHLSDPSTTTIDSELSMATRSEEGSMITIGSELSYGIRIIDIGFRLLTKGQVNNYEAALILDIIKAEVIIGMSDTDGFISKLLGTEPLKIEIRDCSIIWSSKTGLHFEGSAELNMIIPINRTINAVKLQSLKLALKASTDNGIILTAGLTGSANFGPVLISLENIGMSMSLNPLGKDQPPGAFGNLDFSVGFKHPDGLGIALDTNGIKGGGFISRNREEYAGIIDLDIRGFSVQAVALLDTKDTSFLLAIFSRFRTPIQLGAGWKITKIGGLIGINRTVSLSDIASGIRTGILDSILFPDNVIENAPKIINDFKRVFPAESEQHLVGPAIRITYGTPTLITGDLVIILEFPNPFRLSVIGRIRSMIPNEKHPLVQINLAVLGAVDFTNKRLGVYGSLYDSRILDFTLSGDVAIAASWGPKEKNFIMSLGGFNPRFNPPSNFPPFNAPPLKRLSVAFSSDVSLECYLALTTNTLQIGARVDAVFRKVGAMISGFLAFDTLIQFDPLYYVIDVDAGFSVKFGPHSFASLIFSGFIEGPNPHRIKGSVTFSILWWDISVDVDKTFGDQEPELITNIDPWPMLKEALEQKDSWTAELPNWEVVGVVTRESSEMKEGDQMIQPLGTLGVSQKVVPLNHTLTKFGSSDPIENFRFEIISMNNIPASSLVSTQDYFAPAQFSEYENSEKLTLKSYDLMDSGVFFTSAEKEVEFSVESTSYKEISYETIVLENIANKEDIKRTKKDPENDRFFLNAIMSQTFLLPGAAYSSSVANSNKLKYEVKNHVNDSTLVKEKFVIVDEDENMAVKEVPTLEGQMSQSVAINKLKDYKKANPQDKRNLNVVSTFELVEVAA